MALRIRIASGPFNVRIGINDYLWAGANSGKPILVHLSLLTSFSTEFRCRPAHLIKYKGLIKIDNQHGIGKNPYLIDAIFVGRTTGLPPEKWTIFGVRTPAD